MTSGIDSTAAAEAFWESNLALRAAKEQARLTPPVVRLWDGGMTLRGVVADWRDVDFEFIENDTGTAVLQLSLGSYLSQWIMNFTGREKRNVIITIDKQGARWSGIMKSYVVKRSTGANSDRYLEVTFLHDFEQCKHIYVWCNPFLDSTLQFPKLWIIFGPTKWCLLMTLFVNIFRLESAIWTIPDNPLDPLSYISGFDISNWRNVVKPFPLLDDNSNLTIIFGRFQSWFDVAKAALEDAQLTVNVRRYLLGEDPHPFADLQGVLGIPLLEDLFELIPIRNGACIWDIVDNSGWGTQTAFGGSMLTGMVRAVVSVADDGITEGVDVFTGDPTYPNEYYTPDFLGTSPVAPWIVFDAASPYTGVTSSEFEYNEAVDTAFITGGSSMPGVNESISAGINMAGDFLTTILNNIIDNALQDEGPFSAGFIQIPPLGGVMDALAKILYEDVFLAFEQTPTNRESGSTLPLAGLEDILTGLGDFHYFEKWADGASKAFTLGSIMATRAAIWETRVYTTHKIQVADAAPYYAGDNGLGDYWIGNRVGTTVPEYPIPYTIFVERVKKMRYGWGKDGSRGWITTIGAPQTQDPALKALDEVKRVNQALGTLGIL